MPTATVNGVRLFYHLTGDAGPPLALVHGAWGDHTAWDLVVPALAERFRILAHDRRGHSQSERPPGQGSRAEDAADLAALLERLGLAPAHVVGNSSGGSIALRLAARRPDLVRSLIVHEPPLLDLPLDDPAAARAARETRARIGAVVARLATGDLEGGAREFFDTVALGPGAWDAYPPERRRTFVANAPTYLDGARDPEAFTVDLAALAAFPRPVLLTYGDQSLPYFPPIVRTLGAVPPRAEVRLLAGVGHVPHTTHPEAYAATVAAFAEAADAAFTG
jgi:pimeloyl-ACP methyl ester carboxylesterase